MSRTVCRYDTYIEKTSSCVFLFWLNSSPKNHHILPQKVRVQTIISQFEVADLSPLDFWETIRHKWYLGILNIGETRVWRIDSGPNLQPCNWMSKVRPDFCYPHLVGGGDHNGTLDGLPSRRWEGFHRVFHHGGLGNTPNPKVHQIYLKEKTKTIGCVGHPLAVGFQKKSKEFL